MGANNMPNSIQLANKVFSNEVISEVLKFKARDLSAKALSRKKGFYNIKYMGIWTIGRRDGYICWQVPDFRMVVIHDSEFDEIGRIIKKSY